MDRDLLMGLMVHRLGYWFNTLPMVICLRLYAGL